MTDHHQSAKEKAEQAWKEQALKEAGAFDRYYLMAVSDFKSSLKRRIEELHKKKLSESTLTAEPVGFKTKSYTFDEFIELLDEIEPNT